MQSALLSQLCPPAGHAAIAPAPMTHRPPLPCRRADLLPHGAPASGAPLGRRPWLLGAVGLLLTGPGRAQAPQPVPVPVPVPAAAPVRFGILPLGGAAESRHAWEPILAQLSLAIQRPVLMLSVTTYEALDQAIQRDEIDLAFLSGRMALDAVTQHRMRVLAQVMRPDGLPGYRALLLSRKGSGIDSVQTVLDAPQLLRLARGETRSMGGFIVPQLQLFLPHRVRMEVDFLSETIGTHQSNALAVANGEADVATNNTADFERFQAGFPVESARLQVLWQSDLIPHAQVVIRGSYPPELQSRVRDFLLAYGRGSGPAADAQRATLKVLHDLAGFVAADNSSLEPAALLAYQLARHHAMSAQWVNDAAREARLARIEAAYAEQRAALRMAGR